MGLIDYMDKTKATIAILKDWRDQEWKIENGEYKLAALNDRMTAASSRAGTTPVQGGTSKGEDILCED